MQPEERGRDRFMAISDHLMALSTWSTAPLAINTEEPIANSEQYW
jgi:hypothetical protein